MNRRDFFKGAGAISTLAAVPITAIANTSRVGQPDPVWSIIYGTANEIDGIYNTWGKATQDELDAANVSVAGLLAAKIGQKYKKLKKQDGAHTIGYEHNRIMTTAKRFIEVGTDWEKYGIRGNLYRVQAPVEDYGMVEVQAMYVRETRSHPIEIRITVTPLVVASIGYDKFLLFSDNGQYHQYLWSKYNV